MNIFDIDNIAIAAGIIRAALLISAGIIWIAFLILGYRAYYMKRIPFKNKKQLLGLAIFMLFALIAYTLVPSPFQITSEAYLIQALKLAVVK